MLADCCRILTDALAEEMENVKIRSRDREFGGGLASLKSELQRVDALQDAAERVINLKLRYLDMCRCGVHGPSFRELHLFPVWVGFADHVRVGMLDCGEQRKGIVVVRAYYYVSTVIFILYCTLFMWPLVMAYEETFVIASKDRLLLFSGGGDSPHHQNLHFHDIYAPHLLHRDYQRKSYNETTPRAAARLLLYITQR
ncbi:hypothetical protein BV898_09069 [Hypsibius exemplaris]|uniref:Uncharacterized protein n=1 Tax=Hypsibius exemplaris TaxID=2072580 RepID=A0A1W0WNZ5_HYPEX|nr:hypothetical protein BV898_09069 [Hypsibius exemplaris]